NPRPETRDPKPETRDPKPETRNPQPATRPPTPRNPKLETRDPKPETRDPKPATRNPPPPQRPPETPPPALSPPLHLTAHTPKQVQAGRGIRRHRETHCDADQATLRRANRSAKVRSANSFETPFCSLRGGVCAQV
ncbi:hypothetical protein T484DRAFT_1642809, partial [Baffinella frigidus]